MARNSENAPSEPSGRRRPPSEGNSRLREHFRESIRDALSGVDVDELQGRRTLRVPTDVSLLTRDAVTGLEAELAALRAERAELERRAAERAGAAVAVEAPPAEGEGRAPVVDPPRRESRLPWRRARPAAVEVEREPVGAVDGDDPPVAWSPARAMEPVGDRPGAAGSPAALKEAAPLVDRLVPAPQASARPAPTRQDPAPTRPEPAAARPAPQAPADPAPESPPAGDSAPDPEPPDLRALQTAPPSRPPRSPAARRRPRSQLTDSELESVVAPLLAELANLRTEVRQLRGDPEQPAPLRAHSTNRQLAKLAAGLLLGFALIVIALAVVLKA